MPVTHETDAIIILEANGRLNLWGNARARSAADIFFGRNGCGNPPWADDPEAPTGFRSVTRSPVTRSMADDLCKALRFAGCVLVDVDDARSRQAERMLNMVLDHVSKPNTADDAEIRIN
jgi:hypothetical protein